VLFVVGDILGAGIYARVGAVAGQVGGAIWASFALGIGIAALTAFVYGELSSKYPGAGGAALFVHKAFGRKALSFVVAFAVLASGVSSAAAVARVFGGRYLQELVTVPALVASLVFVLVIMAINLRGIRESIWVNACLTAVEISGLLLIVGIGVMALLDGTGDPGRVLTFKEGVSPPLAILAGSAIAFYACLGFEDVANLAEEADDAPRMLPRALLIGLAIAGGVYVLVALTAAMVVEPSVLAESSGPLLEVVKAASVAVPPQLFSVIALLAVSNTALINMIMASRLLYGMAKQGVVPQLFARTNAVTGTPFVAVVFTTLLAVGLVLTGDIGDLANTTVLLLLGSFVLVHAAAVVLRREQVEHAHFRAPAVIPWLGGLTCLALMTQFEAAVFQRAAVLIAIGLVLAGVHALATRARG
jgi:APA family basic amino acid/polyamine antiporter